MFRLASVRTPDAHFLICQTAGEEAHPRIVVVPPVCQCTDIHLLTEYDRERLTVTTPVEMYGHDDREIWKASNCLPLEQYMLGQTASGPTRRTY